MNTLLSSVPSNAKYASHSKCLNIKQYHNTISVNIWHCQECLDVQIVQGGEVYWKEEGRLPGSDLKFLDYNIISNQILEYS